MKLYLKIMTAITLIAASISYLIATKTRYKKQYACVDAYMRAPHW